MKTPYQKAYVETHTKAGLPKMTKDELIKWLINDDIDTISEELLQEECIYLCYILRDGFVGYRKQTLKQLKEEYNERKCQ